MSLRSRHLISNGRVLFSAQIVLSHLDGLLSSPSYSAIVICALWPISLCSVYYPGCCCQNSELKFLAYRLLLPSDSFPVNVSQFDHITPQPLWHWQALFLSFHSPTQPPALNCRGHLPTQVTIFIPGLFVSFLSFYLYCSSHWRPQSTTSHKERESLPRRVYNLNRQGRQMGRERKCCYPHYTSGEARYSYFKWLTQGHTWSLWQEMWVPFVALNPRPEP